jgi:hypothetical protein
MGRGDLDRSLRRSLGAPLALAPLLVTLVVSIALGQTARARAGLAQQPKPSTCLVEASEKVASDTLLLGESTTATLRVLKMCSGMVYRAHIVLVVDGSTSIPPTTKQHLLKGMVETVDRLSLPSYPNTLVGLVGWDDQRALTCDVSNDATFVKSCIARAVKVSENHGAPLSGAARDLGIGEGLRILLHGRKLAEKSDVPYKLVEIMVVLSDGHPSRSCRDVLKSADQVKGKGTTVMTVCVGTNCDERCLRQAATSERFYSDWLDWGGLLLETDWFWHRSNVIFVKQLTITDWLADDMRYVPVAIDPPPASAASTWDQLTWTFDSPPVQGVTVTLRAQPLAAGYRAVSRGVTVGMVDSLKRAASSDVKSIPSILTLDPTPW